MPSTVTSVKVSVTSPTVTTWFRPTNVFGCGGGTTVHSYVTGSELFPTASVPTTSRVCVPTVTAISYGEVLQSTAAPPSSAHVKVRSSGSDWLSVPEMMKLAVVFWVELAGPDTWTTGGSLSGGS